MVPMAVLLAAVMFTGDGGAGDKAGGAKALPRVALETSLGKIVLELDAEKAPKTVENFLAYVHVGHYDGTIFHRVIPGFMIQGGGFDRRHAAEADPAVDRQRGGQRPEEQARHGGHGAHHRPAQRHRAVLHQHGRQRLPRPQREARRRAGATRCSARWSRGWTWSTRSRRCATAIEGRPRRRAGRAGRRHARRRSSQ